MKDDKRYKTALALNIIAFVLGCVGIIFRLVKNVSDFFLYYTQISNVVAVLSSAMFIALRDTQNERIAAAVRGTRYLASCMLTMTFFVVMCIFVPFGTAETTARLLFSVNGLLHHAVCPVLSVVSYIAFEDGVRSRRAMLIPISATAVYAFTMYALNYFRLAPAPYPFFEVHDHPVPELIAWFFGLMLMVFAIAAGVMWCSKKCRKKQ